VTRACVMALSHRLSRLLPAGFGVRLSLREGKTREGPFPGGIRRRLDQPPPRLPVIGWQELALFSPGQNGRDHPPSKI